MLHVKFDQDWPTGLRDIQVRKCGRRRTRVLIQNLMQPFPTPLMLHIKFDQDWPATGLRDIQV